MESKKRSIVKSLIWRLIGIFVLGIITWFYTRNVETTTTVTVLFHSINLGLYFIHERLWDSIEWGLLGKSDLTEENREKILNRLRKLGYIE